MKTFVQPGSPLTVTTAADTKSGDLVKLGSLIGVAAGDALTGEPLVLNLLDVFEVAKLSTDDVAVGDTLYFDAALSHLTKSGSGNTYAGVAAAAAGVGTTMVQAFLGYPPRTAAVTCTPAKLYLTLDIADLNGTVPAYTVAPIAGTITGVQTVVQPDTTYVAGSGGAAVAAEATVTIAIGPPVADGGTSVTGGVVTIASGATLAEVDTATATAANVVDVGDVISAVGNGADTAAHPCKVIVEITPA